MKEIVFFSNEYIFMANILLLISYLQTNILILRLVFVSAYTFLFIFSLSLPVISLDSVLFSLFFCFINIYLSLPLIQSLIPPDFTKDEKDIFINHFKGYLSPKECKHLLDSGKRKVYRVNSCLFRPGNEFSSLFFAARVGKNCELKIKSKNLKNLIVNEYSWIGVPEYLNILSKKTLDEAINQNETGEWKVQFNLYVKEKIEKTDETTLMMEDDLIILYEFELKILDNLFNKTEMGYSIMRGLHSIWLKYCSGIIKKVDLKAIEKRGYWDRKKSSLIIDKSIISKIDEEES